MAGSHAASQLFFTPQPENLWDYCDMLSFTNSTSDIAVLSDVRKISYQCLDGGQHFGISYHGFFGYRILAVSNNFRKREAAFQHLNATNQNDGN